MMILDIIFIFSVIYLQLVIHELTHAALILFFKQKISQIKLYPHKINGKIAGGAVTWIQTSPLSKNKLALISLGPMIMGIFLFSVFLAIGYSIGFSKWIWFPAQIALLDTITNLFCHFSSDRYHYDYTKGMTHLGFNHKQQTIIAILSIIFLSGILIREFIANMAGV